jgi:MYXO-CTERM domain-containing protein
MLGAGETGQYSLTIRGGPAVTAGVDVAADEGVRLVPGPGTKLEADELVHSSPQRFADGTVRFDFSVVAPSQPGRYRLYGVGNSTDGRGDTAGDHAVATTLELVVSGPQTTPPPPPPVDTGTPTPPAPAPEVDTPAPQPTPQTPPPTIPGSDTSTDLPPDDGVGGCTAVGGPPAVLLLTALGALLRRRRRS